MTLLQSGLAKSAAVDAYTIDQSLRFNRASNDVLSRTPGSTTDRQKWTLSVWTKRAELGTGLQTIFGTQETVAAGGAGEQLGRMAWDADNELTYHSDTDASFNLQSTPIYRDPGSWYHVVIACDTTQSTDTNRLKFYVNGTQITAFGTTNWPALNLDTPFNYAHTHRVGASYGDTAENFDGYLAEFYWIDGTQLTPSSFAETDEDTNQWKPIDSDTVKDAVTFGTNGFYQKYAATELANSFTDSSTGGGDSPHTITANGDVANTRAQSKVGDSSIVFDGTGDYLSLAATDDFNWNSFSGYTFETWIRPTSLARSGSAGAFGSLFNSNSGGTKYGIGYDTSGYVYLWYWDTAGSATQSMGPSTSTLSIGTWTHVAIVKSGTNILTFMDGVLEATTAIAGTPDSGTVPFWIGRNTSAEEISAYLSEVRMSDTARYTSTFTTFGQGGGTISNPTAFTTDSNTMFLLHSNWDGGLGADSSGNNNDFAVTNLVATDQMGDSPTNNFSTWNPLTKRGYAGGDATLAEGNLKGTTSTSYNGTGSTFIVPSSGKWYAEFTPVTINSTSGLLFGIADPSGMYTGQKVYDNNTPCAVYRNGGLLIYTGDTSTSTDYSAYVAGDIIGVAIDVDEDEIWFAKNNTWQGSSSPNPSTGTSGHDLSTASGVSYTVIFGSGSTHNEVGIVNFGQDSSFAGTETAQGNADANGVGDFYYSPPTDFLALASKNLPVPSIIKSGENFNTVLYTGNGTSLAVTGVGFQPDFVNVKSRSAATSTYSYDAIRGTGERMVWDGTYAESSISGVTSFDSDGFTVGTETGNNLSTGSFVSWSWLGASSNASNSEGSITSVVRANTTAGFSIVSYTGDDASSATLGHGLSEAPELVIIKSRDSTEGWYVGSSEGSMSFTSSDYLTLNTTGGESSSDTIWNDTAPTATVFTVGTNDAVNAAVNYISYCFHSIEGYSKVGGYTGNGNADGTFVYTGFRPAFVLLKHTNTSDSWPISDRLRGGEYNGNIARLRANTAGVEDDNNRIDFLSNGFKIIVSYAESNADAGTYLYYAVAEYPFKYAPAR